MEIIASQNVPWISVSEHDQKVCSHAQMHLESLDERTSFDSGGISWILGSWILGSWILGFIDRIHRFDPSND